MTMDYRKEITAYFEKEKQVLDAIRKDDLNTLMNVLMEARDQGKNIFIMGNGGSAATASHYVCDFNKGISFGKEKMFKFICLNDNLPTMMAYANDMSYADIFAGPLKNFMQEGDIVIGISGSGNSENVVRALQYAKYNLHVPVDDMQIAEDLHMVIDHCMMKILCQYAK